jgi:hypothetical protein
VRDILVRRGFEPLADSLVTRAEDYLHTIYRVWCHGGQREFRLPLDFAHDRTPVVLTRRSRKKDRLQSVLAVLPAVGPSSRFFMLEKKLERDAERELLGAGAHVRPSLSSR